jgi:methionyl-tRNA formyltransferase
MRIIFAGSGAFGLPSLKSLCERYEVVQVVSQPDRQAGRGRHLHPTPISEFAVSGKLPLERTEDINSCALADSDVLVVIAFGQKISPELGGRPRFGSINLHASLLPKFRGAAPIPHTMLAGESITGNSVIRLSPRMDAGAVLGQSRLTIGELETAGELHDRLADDGAILLTRVLDDLVVGRPVETPQDESKASRAGKLGRGDARVDFIDAAATARKIRALWPWPTCHVRLLDAAGGEVDNLALKRARCVGGEGSRWRPGEIGGDGAVSAGDGGQAVEILELQPAGKRCMSMAEYRRGHSWMPGMRLVAPE